MQLLLISLNGCVRTLQFLFKKPVIKSCWVVFIRLVLVKIWARLRCRPWTLQWSLQNLQRSSETQPVISLHAALLLSERPKYFFHPVILPARLQKAETACAIVLRSVAHSPSFCHHRVLMCVNLWHVVRVPQPLSPRDGECLVLKLPLFRQS